MRRFALVLFTAALVSVGCGRKTASIPQPPPAPAASPPVVRPQPVVAELRTRTGTQPAPVAAAPTPALPEVVPPPSTPLPLPEPAIVAPHLPPQSNPAPDRPRAARTASIFNGATERGVASWYGYPFHGRAAADGEIYDMETLVAAHRTLPFQTVVRVRNVANNKTVDVRIMDRGPFVDNRVIDLSHAAAGAIGMVDIGVAKVELTILSTPVGTGPAFFAVQVGAFRERGNADRMQQSMIDAYGSAKQVLRQGDPQLWRILAGREASVEAAEALARRIRKEQGVPQAFVVRLDP